MLSNPSILASPLLDAFVVTALLLIFALVGHALGGNRLHGSDPLERLASTLIIGMLFTIGTGVTCVYGRVGAHTAVPLILLVVAVFAHRRMPAQPLVMTSRERWLLLGSVAAIIVVSTAFHAWFRNYLDTDGTVRLAHSDLGFFAMLYKGLPLAKVSNGWAGAAGSTLIETGLTQDQWYHWGPVWLTMLIIKATGLPALECLLNITSSVLAVMLVLVAGAIVRALTGWSTRWSLIVGAVSIIALPYPSVMLGMRPFALSQHARDSLLGTFPYYFEALHILPAILCWLRGRTLMSVLMIALATISSPHFVGGAGVALGGLMIVALLFKERSIAKPAAIGVGTILASWLVVRWVLGMGLPAAANPTQGIPEFNSQLIAAGVMTALDTATHFGICLLLIPGWIMLYRNNNERTRLLAMLAVTGVIGGMIATHWIKNAESFHFTDFPCSSLAYPIAIWGLAVLIKQHPHGWRRHLAVFAIIICGGFGASMIAAERARYAPTGWTVEQLNALKAELKGETFAYITKEDRPWWIPKYSLVAALLDSRCIRLNPIKQADIDDRFSQFYSSYLPMELVPFKPGDDINVWCVKLARALKINYILHTQPEPVPASIARHCTPVFTNNDIILYRINAEAETEPPALLSATSPPPAQ